MDGKGMADLMLEVDASIDIKAGIEQVFEGLMERLSSGSSTPEGTPLPMKLERRPGGRWYRDLGDGAGHLWGLVQVYKPPELLELHGPMFMSYPVAGHIQIRLTSEGDGTRVRLRHRAFGLIDDAHRQGVVPGWNHMLEGVKKLAEK